MKPLSYAVYEARWEGNPAIWDGQEYALAYEGDIAVLNSRFGPLPQTTSPIPQLERVRVEANERSERGMCQGDLIRLEYDDDSRHWWLYDAGPMIGGFSPVVRSLHLTLIAEGIADAEARMTD